MLHNFRPLEWFVLSTPQKNIWVRQLGLLYVIISNVIMGKYEGNKPSSKPPTRWTTHPGTLIPEEILPQGTFHQFQLQLGLGLRRPAVQAQVLTWQTWLRETHGPPRRSSNKGGFDPNKRIWLVVCLPLWKIWVCQLGWWNSQYLEKIRNVSKHQPV